MLRNIQGISILSIVCKLLLFTNSGVQAQTFKSATHVPSWYNQPSPARLATTFSRPLTSNDYFLDNLTWLHSGVSTYTYNKDGQLTERHIIDPATSQSYRRFSYTYDLNGKEIGNIVEGYDPLYLTWYIISGTVRQNTYTPQGKLAETTETYWTNNNWVNRKKYFYTYNSSGNLVEEKTASWTNTNWKMEFKIEYQYTNNVITKILHYNLHVSGNWVPTYQYINLTWHNQSLLQLSGFTGQLINNGVITDRKRSVIVYSPNGSIVETSEGFVNGNWALSSRYSYLNDSLGNFIGKKEVYRSNNAWHPSAGELHYLTYNSGNDLTQRNIWYYKSYLNAFVEERKEVYSNFQMFVTGTKKDKAAFAVEVYPNPTQNQFTISLPQVNNPTITATLTDVTGKSILTKTIAAGTTHATVSTEHLPAGIYMLHLQTTNSQQTFKIVKQ